MRSLQELLALHNIPGVQQAQKRRICADTLTKMFGITVTPEQVKYKEGTLMLRIAPVFRSALLLRQAEICANLSAQGVAVETIR